MSRADEDACEEMNGRGRNSATGREPGEIRWMVVVAARLREDGAAGSFDDRSFGRRRRSLIIARLSRRR